MSVLLPPTLYQQAQPAPLAVEGGFSQTSSASREETVAVSNKSLTETRVMPLERGLSNNREQSAPVPTPASPASPSLQSFHPSSMSPSPDRSASVAGPLLGSRNTALSNPPHLDLRKPPQRLGHKHVSQTAPVQVNPLKRARGLAESGSLSSKSTAVKRAKILPPLASPQRSSSRSAFTSPPVELNRPSIPSPPKSVSPVSLRRSSRVIPPSPALSPPVPSSKSSARAPPKRSALPRSKSSQR